MKLPPVMVMMEVSAYTKYWVLGSSVTDGSKRYMPEEIDVECATALAALNPAGFPMYTFANRYRIPSASGVVAVISEKKLKEMLLYDEPLGVVNDCPSNPGWFPVRVPAVLETIMEAEPIDAQTANMQVEGSQC